MTLGGNPTMAPERTTSRRALLTASAAVGAAALAAGTGTGAHADDTDPARRDGRAAGLADTVLAALRRHRLVAFGESGTHGLQEHHDAVTQLLVDPRLPAVLDDIVVEFGNARYQQTVDGFVSGTPVDNATLRQVWRNTTQSPVETWDAPVFEQLFRTVRAVNQTLRPAHRIRVLLGDPPIDWPTITNGDQLSAFLMERGAHAGTVVRDEVLRKGRRALILYGDGHVLHPSGIEKEAGERAFVITGLVPLAGDPAGLDRRLAGYPPRTTIPTAGTWLGSLDAGNVYPNAFRGPSGQPINAMCGVPLGTVVDAGVYFGQSNRLTVSWPNPASYLDPAYWDELRRRNDLQGGRGDLDALRREQPATLTLATLPPFMRCS
jgi:hypothetical protein